MPHLVPFGSVLWASEDHFFSTSVDFPQLHSYIDRLHDSRILLVLTMSRISCFSSSNSVIIMLIILIELISVSYSVGSVGNFSSTTAATTTVAVPGLTVDSSSNFSTASTNSYIAPEGHLASNDSLITTPTSPLTDTISTSTEAVVTQHVPSEKSTVLASTTTRITITERVGPDTSSPSKGNSSQRRSRPQQSRKTLSLIVSSKSAEVNQESAGAETGAAADDERYPTSSKSSKNGTYSKISWCKNSKNLDQCLLQVPPMPDIGIPSSSDAVQTACKAFNVGMGCVDSWTKRCLKPSKAKMFQESISGAHETFAFLCRDSKFRTAYLKHGECYRKISPKWDECSRNFIDDMKRFHSHGNTTIHCCIRFMFLKCVAEISHYYCDRGASEFLQKMAETLIRSTMKYHTPPQCVSVQPKTCSLMSSSSSSLNNAQARGINRKVESFVMIVAWHLLITRWIS